MAGAAGKRRLIPLLRILEDRYSDQTAEELYALILCGDILVDGGTIRDPKLRVREDADITVRRNRDVSRGREKLESALNVFSVTVRDKYFIDAGCSTGGFTQCLLEKGAAGVYAVDVGYNLLDFSLRNDSRVRVHERTNIMEFTCPDPPPHGAVADLSFRSIQGAASRILAMTTEKWMIALIKPQFEWKNPPESFNGVVSEPDDRAAILSQVVSELEAEGVGVHDAVASAIPGRKGNQEYLFLLRETAGCTPSGILKMLGFSD